MNRARTITLAAVVAIVLLLAVGWWGRWFASEPVYRGRTVTEWLDKLIVYDTQEGTNANGDRWSRMVPREISTVTNDPAFLALMNLGSKAVPVLVQRVADPAEWSPDVGVRERTTRWLSWKWQQLRGAKGVLRPAPTRYSPFQTRRKTAAGFALLALGTDVHGGFPAYMLAYAAAPKHQTIAGTKITGSPLGVSSSHVAMLGKALLPHRREEILADILRGMGHTNAWCRTVATEMVWEFPEEFRRLKNPLIRLAQDADPMVQETAMGRLHSMAHRNECAGVMSPLELERVADAALENPATTSRVRGIAESVKRSARRMSAN